MPRKKRKVHYKARRRVSGLKLTPQASTGLQILGGAIVGAVVKRFADKALAKQDTVNIDPKTLAAIELAGGLVLTYLAKNPLLQGVGIGFATESAVKIAQEMDLISGAAVSYTNFRQLGVPRPNMNGAAITPTVAGASLYNFPQTNSIGKVKKFAAAS